MIVTITSTGGFANIGNGSAGPIDVDTLPPEMQQRVIEAFDYRGLNHLNRTGPSNSVDCFVYSLRLQQKDGRTYEYTLLETDIPSPLLDLIDELKEMVPGK